MPVTAHNSMPVATPNAQDAVMLDAKKLALSPKALTQLTTLLSVYAEHFKTLQALMMDKKAALIQQNLEGLREIDQALLSQTKALQQLDTKRQQWQRQQEIPVEASLNLCLAQIELSLTDPLHKRIHEQAMTIAQHTKTLAQLNLQLECILQQSLHWIAYSVQTIADLTAPPSPTYSNKTKKTKLSPYISSSKSSQLDSPLTSQQYASAMMPPNLANAFKPQQANSEPTQESSSSTDRRA